MYVALRILGVEVLCLVLADDAGEDDETGRALSGGTTSSYPVGFSQVEVVDEHND
jgi:hypothetical protein